MKPTIPAVALSLALALSPVMSSAQTDAIQKDVEERVAATELVTVSQVDAMVEQMTFLFTHDILPLLIRENPGKDELLKTIVTEEVTGATKDMAPHLVSFMTEIYLRNFTHEEILAITEFYRSPAGQKLLKMQPVISRDSQKAGVELSKQTSFHAMSRIRERMKAEELVMPPRL